MPIQEFGLHIDDDSEMLSDFASELNQKTMVLYDWQRRAIEFFFKNNGTAMFEVTTGAGKTFTAIQILKEIWKRENKKLTTLIEFQKMLYSKQDGIKNYLILE